MELLQIHKMRVADQYAIDQGIPSLFLMEQAGLKVARAVEDMCDGPTNVHIYAGTGNNGGDAFVVARFLKRRDYKVTLDLIGKISALKDEALANALRWRDMDGDLNQGAPRQSCLGQTSFIIDGIIGAGLKSNLKPELCALIETINAQNKPVLAIDIPTGVNGDTGAASPIAIKAQKTVTFFRPKPGHLLYPGRVLCGTLKVVDIGIPERAIESIKPNIWQNEPDLWQAAEPHRNNNSHKYNKGAVLIACGEEAMAGANSLAANAAMRAGAGLVTIAEPKGAMINPHLLAAIMSANAPDDNQWCDILKLRKIDAVLIGPGAPANDATRAMVLKLLDQARHVCLDAGALTAFADQPAVLIEAIANKQSGHTILTPHEGEFKHLFGDFHQEGKLAASLKAAQKTNATIVLKGADTVIASPDGRAIINTNAPSTLATAGTGDVLAGMITAGLAKEMLPLEAAACAVYKHAEAANLINHDLVADDISPLIPKLG